jgi:hypothetical protein
MEAGADGRLGEASVAAARNDGEVPIDTRRALPNVDYNPKKQQRRKSKLF